MKWKTAVRERPCGSARKHLEVNARISMFPLRARYCLGRGNSIQHLSPTCHWWITSPPPPSLLPLDPQIPKASKSMVFKNLLHTCHLQNSNSNLFKYNCLTRLRNATFSSPSGCFAEADKSAGHSERADVCYSFFFFFAV